MESPLLQRHSIKDHLRSMYRHFELKRSLEWISHTKITRIACERVNPEKHQTKQANEDDEQEHWAQKETFFVYVCQRWNRGDKVQLEDESGFRLCCELVILCTGKAAPLGKEGNIASDKVR